MKIPNSNRKKALFIIDVQSDFLDSRNNYIVDNILKLLDKAKYDLYVEAVFYSKKGSMWDKQQHMVIPKNENTHTIDNLQEKLSKLKTVKVEKQTRSIFKEDSGGLLKKLKDNNIEEIHIIGTQTNDCVFASAIEAFDLGFFSYVIEECCETATKELQEQGIALLRRQNMTNNSFVEKIDVLMI